MTTNNVPFERTITDHGATVLRVCRSVLGSGPDAEDAAAETFIAALRQWPDFDPGTNIEAWLVRVAQRKAVDVIRARARRAQLCADLPEMAAEQEQESADTDVWQSVAQLPEKQRLAIAYHYLGGLPHAETADLIGCSAAAARKAASDGIKTLRRMNRDETRADETRADEKRADEAARAGGTPKGTR